ncbi:hypothetical protein [Legionella sp.]|uniref:hypothetical protein n=1 Tax=Legionella sp. TaxID=459 RepID=UPI003C914CF1
MSNYYTVTTHQGISLQFNNVADQLSIVIGYRFFYLGQGKSTINNQQSTISKHLMQLKRAITMRMLLFLP